MDLPLSDFDSFSETSSGEDQDYIESMFGGQACSILSSLEESIGKIDDFLSFERGFGHGDIVCLVTDLSGQMGRVINVDVTVDLENMNGDKIKNVSSKELQKMRSISVGDYVVNGPWLGQVDKVIDSVTVLFDDGTKTEFTAIGLERLIPISPDLFEDSSNVYYPGQRVQAIHSSASKSSRWLCGTQKEKQNEGTVRTIDAGLVYVDWLGCALVGCEGMTAPPRLQDSKKLILLSCFSHASWQLGDWCVLPGADSRGVIEKSCLSASNFWHIRGHQQPENKFERGTAYNQLQEIFVIVKTKTKVDVLWQDGSWSLGLDPQLLFPVTTIDAHDFWPEQFVLAKGTCDDPHCSSNEKWGVVRCVDAKERTVKVEWKTVALMQAVGLEAELIEETVSAYELVEHPEYSFCIGDMVFRLQNIQFVDPANTKSSMENMVKIGLSKEVYDYDNEDCSGYKNENSGSNYLFHIGIIMGFNDGDIEVKWATGRKTKVAPYEIIRVDKYEVSSASTVIHDTSTEELNDEMIQHDNESLIQKGKVSLDFHCDGEGSNSFSFPRAAVGFFTKITASLFGSLGSISISPASDHISEDEGRIGISREEEELFQLHNQTICTEEMPLVVVDSKMHGDRNSEQIIKETEGNNDLRFSRLNTYPALFRQFDMVSNCSDHHFIDAADKGKALSQAKRGWLKKIQQEWSILQKDLPETIYVRVFEERMDLLRAAVVGAPGTPYHDNLFFFDIFLPPEYPHEPPLVHYNSGGLRVNPNLYESGRVCLSLLNTWTGTGSEVWNPGSSSILQVLLSLQAIVLNEKPYFNEAGYDQQVGKAEGERNSATYNENAFLVNCKSMLYLLRNPPKHFEELVEEHFSRHSKEILQACKAYREGAPVGCAFTPGKIVQEGLKGNSTGFKIMLAKLFPKLVEAFSGKGIDCSPFLGQE